MEPRINKDILFLDSSFDLARFRARPSAELKALSESPNYRMKTDGGVAVIPVRGPINRGEGYYGETDMYDVIRNVNVAKNDPSISAALFIFDSPGGTACGCTDVAESIAALSAVKPTVGYSFMCCSAAYFMASQVKKLYSSASAMNGSIGVKMETYDLSEFYESSGIKVNMFETGTYKNAGHEARSMSEDERKYLQGMVDDLFAGFVDAVAKGRKMSKAAVKDLQAKVFIGEKGISAGLIDGVMSLDEVYANTMKLASKAPKSNMIRSRQIAIAKAKLCI